ncbi:hypothetical protein [Aquibacillus rhizosphaerae]|uniref:Uncharacterized protein n=1 Tax=Aquibacillus rhizosphaerae TaxID=3051431 RepID=A0ABT7L8M6_9BACI|nr:hypothetical protein [Aquibacillus sp. LR5S19]MDL4842235.1 hypothetical protein [Aquibacillus sp. LR5S19]
MDNNLEDLHQKEQEQDRYQTLKKGSFWYWGLLLFLSVVIYHLGFPKIAGIILATLIALSLCRKTRYILYFLLPIGITGSLVYFGYTIIGIIIGILTAVICFANYHYSLKKSAINRRLRRAS